MIVKMKTLLMSAAGLVLVIGATTQAASAAILSNSGFTTNTVPRNDDGSTGLVPLGFTANFFGTNYSSTYVNNNGNITFDAPLVTYTPFGLTGVSTKIIAPFFADVDTRSAGNAVTYGTDTVDGHPAFGVDYINVDYYFSNTTHTNRDSFQEVLIDRSDITSGDFDIEYNYDQIQWETGTASGGSDINGRGGTSAAVGYSNGLSGSSNVSYQLPGSLVNGALLDGGPNALISNSINSTVPGRYIFNVRNGAVVTPPPVITPPPVTPGIPPATVPEPSATAGMLAFGTVGAVSLLKGKRKQKVS